MAESSVARTVKLIIQKGSDIKDGAVTNFGDTYSIDSGNNCLLEAAESDDSD